MKSAQVTEALAGLARRHALDERQRERLASVLEGLAEDDQAPTTVREPQRAVYVHLADSLIALELDAVRAATEIVDVGAGAGFPGLPLAVALPNGDVTLLDSQQRKCSFMERLVRSAGIANARVVCARVEEWPEGLGVHDMVLARALGPQPVVLEYAAPLLELGGCLVDWRGSRDAAEEHSSAVAGARLGMELEAIRRVEPFEGVRDHYLHVYVKRGETPDRFPRRSGMARKRPLA